MKLANKYQIEKAASNDPTRFVLKFVHIDKEKQRLIATDGRMLASVPVELDKKDDLGSLSIPPDVLKEARKQSKKEIHSHIKMNGVFELPNGSTMPRPSSDDVGHYPQYDQIIPKEPLIKHTITFNPERLLELSKAIGWERGDSVTLEFQDQSGNPAIIVRRGDGYGLLMPMNP